MTHFAIFLVLASTFMHAGWNVLARRHRNERIFFGRLLGSVAVIGFIPFILSELSAGSIPLSAWMCVTGSGILCGTYFFFLARSYESADFTIAYPVARALPVLLLALGDALRGRPPSAGAFAGITMVGAGCFLIPLKDFRQIKLKNYINKGTLFMLLAAGGTVGYSLLDKIGSELVDPGPGSALRYGYLFYLFAFLTYLFFPARIKTHNNCTKKSFLPSVLSGLMSFSTYALVLWAYQITRHASYVVAFRQFSIVIGVITGLMMFREKGVATRITGTLLLTGGLLLISIKG